MPFFVFQKSIFIRGFGDVPKDADEDDEHEFSLSMEARRAPIPVDLSTDTIPAGLSKALENGE